jgi:hypothetical protein
MVKHRLSARGTEIAVKGANMSKDDKEWTANERLAAIQDICSLTQLGDAVKMEEAIEAIASVASMPAHLINRLSFIGQ